MSIELKYLIIEDSLKVCEGISERMACFTKWKLSGFALHIEEANQLINRHRPQLIFIDWALKGGSAFEVLQKIQNLLNYDPYIIFNTGYQSENPEIPQEIINHYRVDKYLVKPLWENLRKNLSIYVSEAEEKGKRANGNAKCIWLEDDKGVKLLIDLTTIICICQHPERPRSRLFYLTTKEGSLSVPIQWQKCYDILTQTGIDYFITKYRSHLVVRNHIQVFDKPFVRLKGFKLRVEVVKENIRDFEKWLSI
jgi:two-component system, LytTR family, response regulator